ncbi:hypothetical protein CRENPOLYSF2_610004 [Crenothrix polyspora]|uniref:Uncharacterized protein n=1 Tax=Crenothrix polyspora TaxID=360316 RepID=A0A1R4HI36_9GAMM|nr:hypothetical protein CRENPOLYSF2_610004 [Crenothrix polyspora]
MFEKANPDVVASGLGAKNDC